MNGNNDCSSQSENENEMKHFEKKHLRLKKCMAYRTAQQQQHQQMQQSPVPIFRCGQPPMFVGHGGTLPKMARTAKSDAEKSATFAPQSFQPSTASSSSLSPPTSIPQAPFLMFTPSVQELMDKEANDRVQRIVDATLVNVKDELTQKITRDIYANLVATFQAQLNTLDEKLSKRNEDEPKMDENILFNVANMANELNAKMANDENNVAEANVNTSVGDNDNGKTEDDANDLLHTHIICDICDTQIRGIRYKCNSCPDYDLCSKCEQTSTHDETHIFSKIKKPLPRNTDLTVHVDVDMPSRRYRVSSIAPIFRGGPVPLASYGFNRRHCGKREQNKVGWAWLSISVLKSSIHSPIATVGTKFRHTWEVRNTGLKRWSDHTTLQLIRNDPGLETLHGVREVSVPPLKSGDSGEVSVDFIVTKVDGVTSLSSRWRLCYRTQQFGEVLACHVLIDKNVKVNNGSVPMTEQMEPQNLSLKDKPSSLEAALSAVCEISTRDSASLAPLTKTDVKSHTTTPTNTPFDISPPKSPVPQVEPDLNIQEQYSFIDSCSSAASTPSKKNDLNVNDRLIGVDNLNEFGYSSSDSSEEFCIIPLPVCFDLNKPFQMSESSSKGGDENKDDKTKMPSSSDDLISIQSNITETTLLGCSASIIDKPIPLNCFTINANKNGNEMEQKENDLNENQRETKSIDEKVQQAASIEKKFEGIQKSSTEPDLVRTSTINNISKSSESNKDERKKSTNPFLNDRQNSEPIINVLPERIVDGALNAAAQVVQGISRAFMSAQNLGVNENFHWITTPPPAIIPLPNGRVTVPPPATNENTVNTNGNTNAPVNDLLYTAVPPTIPLVTNNLTETCVNDDIRMVPTLERLCEMGFMNITGNRELIIKHDYDVNSVIEELLLNSTANSSDDQQHVISTQPRHSLPTIAEFD